ncbi:DUF1571 domain-containing protein [Alicycliphilus denitrificans]|uniref:DUF1571 domain-containing protein n=1 Tax=Alicycliphilus denitrificans TaxID=179636 RepID=UPI003850C6E4
MAWRWPLLALLFLPPTAMAYPPTAPPADPLGAAEACFEALHSYQVTLRATDAAGAREVIRYAFRKPGWVRMDFEQPHRGAVLVYAPDTGRVRLWPFGLGYWPRLDLAPDHPLLRNPRGHRVDRSDVGVLLAHMRALRERGSAMPLGDAQLAGQAATGLEITGPAGGRADAVQRYRVWLAQGSGFPLRVDSFGADGGLIESVDMSDARIDPPLPDRFFTP